MKEVKIFCANSLVPFVSKILENTGIRNYMLLSNISGFKPEGIPPFFSNSSEMEFNVSLFLIYIQEDVVEKIKKPIVEFDGKCETDPCIRMFVSNVEEVV